MNSRTNESISKQEQKSQLTRQKLLQAAVHIIQTQGIAKLNVRAICAEAGLTTGAFYHVFDSKEDVVNYYLSYTFSRYKAEAQSTNENMTAAEKVRHIYQYMVKCYEEAGYEFMSAFYVPTNSMLNYRERPNSERVLLEEVHDYLEQGKQEGTIREGVDLEEAKLEIAMIVTGVMFYWAVFKGQLDAASIVDRKLSEYLATIEA